MYVKKQKNEEGKKKKKTKTIAMKKKELLHIGYMAHSTLENCTLSDVYLTGSVRKKIS